MRRIIIRGPERENPTPEQPLTIEYIQHHSVTVAAELVEVALPTVTTFLHADCADESAFFATALARLLRPFSKAASKVTISFSCR